MVIEMKVAKIKRQEQKQEIYSEEYSFKNMIKILIVILILYGTFYFITTLLVKNKNNNNNENVSEIVDMDKSKIIVSQLLNRTEDEYYVLATKESLYNNSYIEFNYVNIYKEYINKYLNKENPLPFYYVDLDSALNKKYISDEVNITNEISNIKINDEILFKIKDNKIERYYIGKDRIIDKLSRL